MLPCLPSIPCLKKFRDDFVCVALGRQDGVKLAQITEDFGVHGLISSEWIRQADVENDEKAGTTKVESAENRALRR